MPASMLVRYAPEASAAPGPGRRHGGWESSFPVAFRALQARPERIPGVAAPGQWLGTRSS